LLIFLSNNATTNAQELVGDYMGVNVKREDPVKFLDCFGFVREYHDWVADEDPNNIYPSNTYQWSPGIGTYQNFHGFYKDIADKLNPATQIVAGQKVPIMTCMKYTIPKLLGVNHPGNEAIAQEFIPVYPWDTPDWNDPIAYQYYADWVTQYCKHFGGPANTTIPSKGVNETTEPDAVIGYIEPWNEPDKTAAVWFPGFSGSNVNRVGLSKESYLALSAAANNGDGGNVKGETSNGDTYELGVQRFDQLELVMAGISDFDVTYADHLANNVKGSGIINFHHYCDSKWDGVTSSGGVAPEHDRGIMDGSIYSFKEAMQKLKSRYNPQKLWLSEFGYDTNNNSEQRASPIKANGKISDAQEVQGCWIVRSYLEILAAGWEKAMLFFMVDDNSKPEEGTLFTSSGILKDRTNFFQPKKSYWYTRTMREILGNTVFKEELSNDEYATICKEPRVLRFIGQVPNFSPEVQNVLAVWSPTAANESYCGGNYFEIDVSSFTSTSDATMIVMHPNDKDGIRYSLDVVNGKVSIPSEEVNERPIFIVLGEKRPDKPLACLNFINQQPIDGGDFSHGLSCDAIKVVWNAPPTAFDHYLVYYYDKTDSQTPNPLVFNIGDPDWKLYDDNVSGGCNSVSLVGLKFPHDNYQVVVIGVTDAITDGRITPSCITTVRTADCQSQIILSSKAFTITSNTSVDATDFLFDYSNINICGGANTLGDPPPAIPDWGGEPYNSNPAATMTIKFISPVYLDAIRFLDSRVNGGSLNFEFITDNGTYTLSSDTDYYDFWRTYASPTCNERVNQIIVTTDQQGLGRIRKLMFYGKTDSKPLFASCCGSPDALQITSTTAAGINASTISDLTTRPEIRISGTLNITQNTTFGAVSPGPTIYMEPGAKIVVTGGKLLTLKNGTNIQGCEQLWAGIYLNPGSKINLINSKLQDSYYGIRALTNNNATASTPTIVVLQNSNLFSNYHGVYYEKSPLSRNLSTTITSCQFDGLGQDLKPPYATNFPLPLPPNTVLQPTDGIFGEDIQNLIVTGTNAKPTLFANLLSGIVSKKATLITVNKTKFFNIQKSSTASSPYGCGIYAVNTTLSQIGFGKKGAFSFENVNNPFNLNNSIVSITENNTKDIDVCLTAYISRTYNSHITKNTFNYRLNGLAFNASNYSPVVIKDNTITGVNENLVSKAILANGIAFGTADNQIYDIRDNVITVHGQPIESPPTLFGAGVYLSNTKNANVENNVIKVGINSVGVSGDNEHPIVSGIYSVNSPDNTLCSNKITGGTYTHNSNPSSSGYGRGIYLKNSAMNKMSCNVIDSIRHCIELRGNCNMPNFIAGNVLLNSDHAIFAANNVNTPVLLGKQPFTGNRFINDASAYENFAAKYNGDLFLIDQDRFTVKATVTTTYVDVNSNGSATSYTMFALPPTYTAGFFLQDQNTPKTDFICDNALPQTACLGNRLYNPMGEGEGTLKKIANGTLELSNVTEAYKWTVNREIYRELKKEFGVGINTTEFWNFYQQKSGTTVEKSLLLDNAISLIGGGNTESQDRLAVISQTLTDLSNQGSELPVILLNEAEEIKLQLNNNFESARLTALGLNNAYPAYTDYEKLEKEVNAIWLEDMIGKETPNTARIDRIEQISDLCPEDYGICVYKARGVYLAIKGEHRRVWDNCDVQEESQQRDEKHVQSTNSDPKFKLYPNPANTEFFVLGGLEGQQYFLFNALGKQVINGKLSSKPISIGDLQSGIYFFKLEGVNELIKLVISR
jgi:Secretion system C-terminal sorting domain